MKIKLILAWRNTLTRVWTPVGMLKYENDKYIFNYTKGAEVENFTPFGQMSDIKKIYESETLFPIFLNRLLSKNRPEYKDYLNWLDIEKDENNDLLELSISRGIRATDDLQLFPFPEKNEDGNYEVKFFSHGISHISKNYIDRLLSLSINEKLLIVHDLQNKFDENALLLRTEKDPIELLGFCPAFFVNDFNKLLKQNGNGNVDVFVHKINEKAPIQLKLLCKIITKWPVNFTPFDDDTFKSIIN
jgi:hypothetical protein